MEKRSFLRSEADTIPGVSNCKGMLMRLPWMKVALFSVSMIAGVWMSISSGVLYQSRHQPEGPNLSVVTGSSPCLGNTICDAASAISRSMEVFPQGHSFTNWTAIPVTFENALAWRGAVLANSGGIPGQHPYSLQPAWLVAAESTTVMVGDYGVPSDTDTELAAGMWAIWLAPGGELNSIGGLEGQGGNLTISSLLSVQTTQMPIFTPTVYPTITPGPTPTRAPWN
jgi:hypothetical protein